MVWFDEPEVTEKLKDLGKQGNHQYGVKQVQKFSPQSSGDKHLAQTVDPIAA